jgi:CRP-like cAMP-binding protein
VLERQLRNIPLFRELSDENLKSIATRLKRKRFPQGAVIIRQGEADDSVYLVESGLLQVITTAEDADEDNTVDQTQAYIGPGSFVGELAPLLGRPRSATVKVVIDANLWVLRKQDLDELLAEQPSI